MEIILNRVMPTPLASIQHGEDSIWGNHIELQAGKHIMLNASSGKGKSTFTSTLIGLRKDYSGQVTFDGRDIQTYSPEDWTKIRQQKIAVVYQDLQLFPNLSVAENLQVKNKLSDTFTEQELRDQLELLEIDNKWNQQCGLLSMGQQQRVAIIRALSQPFEWLILDEPFSHLDLVNAGRCIDLITKRCLDQKAGFVLTSLGESYGIEYSHELKL